MTTDEFNKEWAIKQAELIYTFMTDYRWVSKVGLSWEAFHARVKLEELRYSAQMYRIKVLGIYDDNTAKSSVKTLLTDQSPEPGTCWVTRDCGDIEPMIRIHTNMFKPSFDPVTKKWHYYSHDSVRVCIGRFKDVTGLTVAMGDCFKLKISPEILSHINREFRKVLK